MLFAPSAAPHCCCAASISPLCDSHAPACSRWYPLACVPFGCCCCGLFYCITQLRGLSCWRRDDNSTWPIFTWATGHGLPMPMITARHHIRARWCVISLPYAYPGDHQIMITVELVCVASLLTLGGKREANGSRHPPYIYLISNRRGKKWVI
jgi:hypothetical protein